MPNDKNRPKKTEVVNKAIDENLRRVYLDIVDEGIPPKFQALLDQLRKVRAPDEDR